METKRFSPSETVSLTLSRRDARPARSARLRKRIQRDTDAKTLRKSYEERLALLDVTALINIAAGCDVSAWALMRHQSI